MNSNDFRDYQTLRAVERSNMAQIVALQSRWRAKLQSERKPRQNSKKLRANVRRCMDAIQRAVMRYRTSNRRNQLVWDVFCYTRAVKWIFGANFQKKFQKFKIIFFFSKFSWSWCTRSGNRRLSVCRRT